MADEPDVVADTLVSRAHDRMRAGDLDSARQLYEAVVAGPASRHLPLAAAALASIAIRQGRRGEIPALFTGLAEAADPVKAALGRTYLSILAVADGRSTPADVARCQEAAEAGDPFASSFRAAIEGAGRAG